MTAGFSPFRLGASTTMRIGFRVRDAPGVAPAPVTSVEVLYPAGLGIGASGLGLESCSVVRLDLSGLAGCPRDSVMGFGSALVEVALRFDTVLERAKVTLVAGPVHEGHVGLIFYVNGEHPLIAQPAFPGVLLAAAAPYGGALSAQLPLVASFPEGPNAALIGLHTTLGPQHIKYTERVGSTTVSFKPKGILLPSYCPRGGFPFAVRLHFENGTAARGETRVACPSRR